MTATVKRGDGSRLSAMRRERGMTQQDLAEKANLRIGTLSHYEQGLLDFDHARIDTVINVCCALQCRLRDVMSDTELADRIEALCSNPNTRVLASDRELHIRVLNDSYDRGETGLD